MGASSARSSLIGRDLARVRWLRPSDRRQLPVAVLGMILAGFALAALRVDITRMSYGLGEAVSVQRTLLEKRRELTAVVLTLRDPARLAREAGRRGFARPERVIDLRAASSGDARP
jgi:hypothetical protein